MADDYEQRLNGGFSDATSLDDLFDSQVEDQGRIPDASEFYYTAEEDIPDAVTLNFDDPKDEEPEKEIKRKKKPSKGKKQKKQKGKKKKTGLVIFIVLLILALLAAGYFYLFGGKKYDVSFYDDSTLIETVKVKEGKAVTLIEAPEKDGYVFIEWQLNGKKYDEESLVGSDLKLTAYYKKSMKVTFLYEDGREFLVVEVGEGEMVKKPEKDPEVKNKAFVTWLTEDNKVFSFLSPVTKDMTLKAQMKDYIKPTGLAYANPSYVIYVKEIKDLPAVVTPGNTTETVTYESSDTEVFTVDERGSITGVKEGTAILTAKVEGLTATTTITVEEKPISGMTFQEGNSLKIGKGRNIDLHVIITPEDATYQELAFKSSNDTIAKVSSTGVVTGVKKGTCTITAYSVKHNEKQCDIQIEVYVPVERIELSNSGVTYLYAGGPSANITANIYPEDADVKTVTWNVQGISGLYPIINNPQINGNNVTISAATAGSLSPVSVIASADGVEASIQIYVEPPIAVISPDDSGSYNFNVGDEFYIAFNIDGYIQVNNDSVFSYYSAASSSISGAFSQAGTSTISITTTAGQTKTVTIVVSEAPEGGGEGG